MIFIEIYTIIFLLLRLLITILNFYNRPCLPKSTFTSTTFISILIPARNEARNLPKLFESLEKQNFFNYELIILNDESTDETSAFVESYIKKNTRCKLINSMPLPQDWLGKNWACHQLSQNATGKYLFFLDADVELNEHFFESILNEIENRNLSLLSVFPDQIMVSVGEKIVVPTMHYILLSLLNLKWVYKLPFPTMAAANGQCMVFKNEIYQQHLFHHQVRNVITEDIEIMKLIKKQKLTGAVYLANNLIKCRMYKNYWESINGFSKNFISGFGNNIFLASFFVLSISGFYSSFIFSKIIVLLIIALIIAIKILISKMSNQNIFYNILFHPLQIISIVIILFKSIYLKLSGNNRWKGRAI